MARKTARIGQFAVAKFDGEFEGDKVVSYDEHLCLVAGRSSNGRELEFIYWNTKNDRTEVITDSLPKGRVTPVGLDLSHLQAEFLMKGGDLSHVAPHARTLLERRVNEPSLCRMP